MGRDIRLGELIRDQRRRARMTLAQLSQRSGLSNSHLGRVERGECFPSAHTLGLIAIPLGLNETEFSRLLTRLLVDELVAAQRHALSILEAISTLSKLHSATPGSTAPTTNANTLAEPPRRLTTRQPTSRTLVV